MIGSPDLPSTRLTQTAVPAEAQHRPNGSPPHGPTTDVHGVRAVSPPPPISPTSAHYHTSADLDSILSILSTSRDGSLYAPSECVPFSVVEWAHLSPSVCVQTYNTGCSNPPLPVSRVFAAAGTDQTARRREESPTRRHWLEDIELV